MKTISENPGYEKCDECEMSTTLYTDDFKEYAILPCKCKVLSDAKAEIEQLKRRLQAIQPKLTPDDFNRQLAQFNDVEEK